MYSKQGISDLPFILDHMGVNDVVISPGLRNAPLIFSFTSHKAMNCISVPDERSAGYIALGMARTGKKPVVLICTSGTAALNYAPAVAEAYYQEVPLIVITADRPAEWIGQRDGQTIQQQQIYSQNIKQSFEVPVETSYEKELNQFHKIINEACNVSLQYPVGPVHVNIPLREPLHDDLPEPSDRLKVQKSEASDGKYVIDDELVELWNKTERKMILIGMADPDEHTLFLINKLKKRKDIVVLAENLSNMKGEDIIACHDRFFQGISKKERPHFVPDLLITMGGPVLSKQLKLLFRENHPAQHWHIDDSGRGFDTWLSLTKVVKAPYNGFLEELIQQTTESSSSFSQQYHLQEQRNINNHLHALQKAPFSDIKAMEKITECLPKNSVVHFGNSTAIRYAQYFETRADVIYYCNRGTSGIDGCLSTAVGSALITDKAVTAVLGDVAFLYDSNALYNNLDKRNLKIVIINNGGGDIFRMLDKNKGLKNREDYFTTPVNVKISKIAEAYSLDYIYCNSSNFLDDSLNALYKNQGGAILEIDTSAQNNVRSYLEYIDQLKNEIYEQV